MTDMFDFRSAHKPPRPQGAAINRAFEELCALSILVYQQGGVDALRWWMFVTGDGSDEDRLERGRHCWANWREIWTEGTVS
jgi:hypothetical protein